MAGTVVADTLQAASTSTLVIKNGVANTPPTIQDSAGTQIGTFCRAWVNFNGTTSPGTIRASFNVTSVTKSSTGVYVVNFTNALPDANYSWAGLAGSPAVLNGVQLLGAPTTSNVTIVTANTSFTVADFNTITVSVFR